MTIYSWKRLFFALLLHPVLFVKFLRLPRSYSSLEEWLVVDKTKCEIVARVIGCKNVDQLNRQQEENMRYRRRFTASFSDWMILSSKEDIHGKQINHIALQYRRRKECHREYEGEQAGLWCYCKKH